MEAGDIKGWLRLVEANTTNGSLDARWNDTWECRNASECGRVETQREYWATLLVVLPFLAVFGNALVILAVLRERSLQTATNYFIVSLAFADLLVAAAVMPFAVYVLVNVDWQLSNTLCDFYIALDVTCSTASIFNLVAISIDRFIAVTQPIKYSKHKSHRRVTLTIAVVWGVSAAIGSPIVLGLNTSPERVPQLCIFYNSDFIIYSSLSSFYIPCLVMVFLYYRIFRAIHNRMLAAHRGAPVKETALRGSAGRLRVVIEVEPCTGTGSEDDDVTEEKSRCFEDGSGGSSVAPNDKLSPDERSFTEEVQLLDSRPVPGNLPRDVPRVNGTATLGSTSSRRTRFNLGKKHKSTRKKRERATAKRERKATKTLAIVIGVFLICWVPFFTCNVLDAACYKLALPQCRPGVTAFLLTTWLGYLNSCVNPVIYTIFNPEFRKAFNKILTCS